jgi:hypothetical protein
LTQENLKAKNPEVKKKIKDGPPGHDFRKNIVSSETKKLVAAAQSVDSHDILNKNLFKDFMS